MKKILVAIVCGAALACSSTALSPDAAKKQLDQLMVLYEENRPKFVEQKQALEQADDCGRATSLREAIGKMAAEAAMQPDDTELITLVKMELDQAEKTCLEK